MVIELHAPAVANDEVYLGLPVCGFVVTCGEGAPAEGLSVF